MVMIMLTIAAIAIARAEEDTPLSAHPPSSFPPFTTVDGLRPAPSTSLLPHDDDHDGLPHRASIKFSEISCYARPIYFCRFRPPGRFSSYFDCVRQIWRMCKELMKGPLVDNTFSTRDASSSPPFLALSVIPQLVNPSGVFLATSRTVDNFFSKEAPRGAGDNESESGPKMYVETDCHDPNPRTEGAVAAAIAEGGFSQTVPNSTHKNHSGFEENLKLSMQELSYHHHHHHQNPIHEDAAAVTAMEIELQQQLAFNMDNSVREKQEIDHFNQHHPHQDQQLQQIDNGHQSFDYSSQQNYPYTPEPDLLNLFHLPRYSVSPLLTNSSISFSNPSQKTANYQNAHGLLEDAPTAADSASGASFLYDPLFHLNLHPQPPLIKEYFESLPNGYMPGSRNGSFSCPGGDEREGSGSVYQDGDLRQFENGVLEFTSDMACIAKAEMEKPKPQSTRGDNRCGRETSKRPKTEDDDAVNDEESCNMKPLGDTDHSFNGSLRCSWLRRKSKYTEVDVRIIHDEVTIKLVQRKNNCLVFVSKALDELQLDLHHVASGHIGDFYSFLINSKICEGSSVYASSIADKLIEVVDRQCAAVQPTAYYRDGEDCPGKQVTP
ncbi:Transcription factor bHLH89 [Morella rubra]|uniref:Transcription factor bHLH89 n=1 Tax=Morella rubra TaxID=262757 RepID=A0A6A1VNL2_9ROSI|nr:Transcription factor bHLH89 [Morella rubra]